jgi:hypothetical protein
VFDDGRIIASVFRWCRLGTEGHMRVSLTACSAAIVVATVVAAAQGPRSPQRAASDLALIPIASAAQTQEFTIRWTPYPGTTGAIVPGGAPPAAEFAIVQRRAVPGPLPRERKPQLSADQLAAIAVDAMGREVDWQLIKDPRVIRAERPGPDGQLTGQVLHRPETELLLTLPANGTVVEIALYEPSWTGESYVLRYLGAIPLTVTSPR